MHPKKDYFLEIEKFSNVFFILILGVFITFCILMIWPFIKILGWAVALAIVWYPVHNFILRKLKHPTVAAFLSCFLIVVVVVVPAIFLTMGIVQEGGNLAKIIQSYIEKEKYKQLYNPLNIKIVKSLYQYISQYFDFSKINLQTTLSGALKQISSFAGKQGVSIVKNTVLFVVQTGLILVIFFFLLKDGKKIILFLHPFIPLSTEKANLVLSRATETIRATVYGWLVVGIIQGTLLGTVFAILRLPSPLFWGGITIVLCFIPFIGAPVVWIPASIILAVKGIWWKAIVLALFGGVVINLTDNFLRPLLVGTKLKLHPMVIFFAIFGGVILMGPVGLLIGPVILSVTIVLLDVLKIKLNQEDTIITIEEQENNLTSIKEAPLR